MSEVRAGHRDAAGNFVDAPGGSLINDRAINASIQERVSGAENVRAFRMSTNTLGLGFVEAINSNTLIAIANNQPARSGGLIAGQVIQVPLFESAGAARVGRFGWKNQHASLLSFSADAYLNEVGITNRFLPDENTSLGFSVAGFDRIPDPEDTDNDIDAFAAFMRFVPEALGNKIIHPFSDFLLHDIGTGDGIVQNGGQATANKLRTMPLWGVRTHARHMHDGLTLTFNEAILRHAGEARGVTSNYRALSATQQSQIITFLKSL